MNNYEIYTKEIEECLNKLKSLNYSESEIDKSFSDELIGIQNKMCLAGFKFNEILATDTEIDNGEILFSLEKTADNIYRAKLNELLEKRYKLNSAKDNLALYTQTINYYHTSYWLSLQKSNVDIMQFKKVSVVFIHHFRNKKQIKDLDNFEYKNFIDTVLVQGGFLSDDNPKYLKTIYTSFVEEVKGDSYTEVLWGNPDDISYYLIERSMVE